MSHLHDTITSISTFFNISVKPELVLFPEWSTIDKGRRGVYILVDRAAELADAEYVYVGKGYFRARQKSHWVKANDIVPVGHIDPKGWKWLRANTDMAVANWHLYVIDLHSETALSAMEGGLIHLLQPLANDETFTDRKHLLTR
jgi:tetrahydromethanopterin S-methyltransferase subunit H